MLVTEYVLFKWNVITSIGREFSSVKELTTATEHPAGGNEFLVVTMSSPILSPPPQSSIRWALFFAGVKLPEHETDDSLPSLNSIEVKIAWNFHSIILLMILCLGTRDFSFPIAQSIFVYFFFHNVEKLLEVC
jgi:hypothetical protein